MGEKHPDYALTLNNLAMNLYEDMGEYAEAERLLGQALAIRKEVLGDKHPDYVNSLSSLAGFHQTKGEYTRAETLYKEVVATRKEILGERDLEYASALNRLGQLYVHMGDTLRAEPLLRQALAIRKDILGERHRSYAQSLYELGKMYLAKGDYVRAEPFCRQALEVDRKTLGAKHPSVANSLSLLATLYQEMGDYARAEAFVLQALAIDREALGEQHPAYAITLTNAAILYSARGDYQQAERMTRQALAIRERTLPRKHPSYANSLNSMGALCRRRGDDAAATEYYQRGLDVWQQVFGQDNVHCAVGLHNLAVSSIYQRDWQKAESYLQQSLRIRRAVRGEFDPAVAGDLSDLALLSWVKGDYLTAETFSRQAVEAIRQHNDRLAAVQSERQQLARVHTLRDLLDRYLSLTAEANLAGEQVYPQVLAWKGAVSARQRAIRALQRATRGGDKPEVARLYQDLDQATRRLAVLSQLDAADRDHRRKVQELSDAIERLERKLAEISQDFRRQVEQRRRTADDLRRALPAGSVLVDVLVYDHAVPTKEGPMKLITEVRLAAFVVRPDRDRIERVNLGPAQPVTEALNRWRLALQRRFRTEGDARLSAEVRRLVWTPLEKHVGDAKLVLISPDGALTRFPWAALPGAKADSYLIEERALAVIAVPQLLPDLLAERAGPPDEPSLLVVGGVNFDAEAGAVGGDALTRSSPRAAARGSRSSGRGCRERSWRCRPCATPSVAVTRPPVWWTSARTGQPKRPCARPSPDIASCTSPPTATSPPRNCAPPWPKRRDGTNWRPTTCRRGETWLASIRACCRAWCWPAPIGRCIPRETTAS